MTKKISLEELKKLATPGKLRFTYTTAKAARNEEEGHDGGGGGGILYVKESGMRFSKNIAYLPNHRDVKEDEERGANAALLAHCWNTHDELVEAVDDLLVYVGEQGVCPAGCGCTLCSAKAALTRAKTVEMP